MNAYCLLSVAVPLVLLGAAVEADETTAQDCSGLTNQSAMTECYGEALLAADEELNRVYVDVMNRLDATGRLEQKPLLREAERAWIPFRDAECELMASGTHGGSAYSMVLAICLADLTRERTEQLRHYLTCEEGDLSCPSW